MDCLSVKLLISLTHPHTHYLVHGGGGVQCGLVRGEEAAAMGQTEQERENRARQWGYKSLCEREIERGRRHCGMENETERD